MKAGETELSAVESLIRASSLALNGRKGPVLVIISQNSTLANYLGEENSGIPDDKSVTKNRNTEGARPLVELSMIQEGWYIPMVPSTQRPHLREEVLWEGDWELNPNTNPNPNTNWRCSRG